jgi:hypothetical protein
VRALDGLIHCCRASCWSMVIGVSCSGGSAWANSSSSVMLSQALDTRSDLTDLQAAHPALAARFAELRDRLDRMGTEDRHQLAVAFADNVSEIRNLAGFETFLLPPGPTALIRQAAHGPVVVINISKYRSDAILLRPQGITSIALPDLGLDSVVDRIRTFHQALNVAHNPGVGPDQRSGAQNTLSEVLGWLWDAAAKPILDELGCHRTPASGAAWPRMWWASDGILGFLPIHAAGYHNEPPGAARSWTG